MASLTDRRRRFLDSVYRHFGEAATWQPAAGAAIPLTVRRRGEDMVANLGDGQALLEGMFLRIPRAALGASLEPDKGDLITITEGGELLKVIAEPRLAELELEWICEVRRVNG